MKYIILFLMVFAFNSSAMALYDQDYIEYDELGIVQINCVRCNDAVKKRMPVLMKLENGDEVYVSVLKTLSNIARVPFDLSDGSYTHLLFCKRCKKKYTNSTEELAGMTKQFKLGFELEARATKQSNKYISKVKNRWKKIKVKKKHEREGRRK